MNFYNIKSKRSTGGCLLCWLTIQNLTTCLTLSAKVGKISKNILNYPRSFPSHLYWLSAGPKALKTCWWELSYPLKQALRQWALVRVVETNDVWLANKYWIPRLLTVTPLVQNTPYFAMLIARLQMLCISYSVNVVNSMLASQYSRFTNEWTVIVATTNASQTSLLVDIWDPLATLRQISIDWPLQSLTTTLLGLGRIDLLGKDFGLEN